MTYFGHFYNLKKKNFIVMNICLVSIGQILGVWTHSPILLCLVFANISFVYI